MKKSMSVFLLLFSVSVLALLGPREAEGKIKPKPMPMDTKRPDPKGTPIFPIPGINPRPMPMPTPFKIPVDFQLPEKTTIINKGPMPIGGGGSGKFPVDPGRRVFSPNAEASFTAPMVFNTSFSAAIGKTQTTSLYVKTSLAKHAQHAAAFKSNMHKHYLQGLWFGPAWQTYPCSCSHWHPYHHHKHHHWWWFQTPNWTACTDWVVYDWTCPFYYDCGVNLVYKNNYVYMNNVSVASYQDYAYQAYLLAEVVPPPPEQKVELLQMGTYYLVSSRQLQETDLVLSLAVSPKGKFIGTLFNRNTETAVPVSGRVHPGSQRVAIMLSETKDLILDTGFHNLTLSHSCVHMHFGNAEAGTWATQTWSLVRADSLPEK